MWFSSAQMQILFFSTLHENRDPLHGEISMLLSTLAYINLLYGDAKMLHLHNITLSFGDRVIFNSLDWVIPVKRRAALIGPNGAGKTTLLKIINGNIPPDDGSIVKPGTYSIGYLPQEEIQLEASSIIAGAMQGKPRLLHMEQEIEKLRAELSVNANDAGVLEKLGQIEHEYEMAGGYLLEGKAKTVLAGMGFAQTDFYRDITEFSGGWRMRVYLARLLLQGPDLLLLDEPTNHLDLSSLEWLEQYLTTFEGSIIIVSHDRFFIDRLAGEIYDLEDSLLTKYVGNYQEYERQKEQNRELLIKKAERQAKERKKQQDFIDRFRYKNTKAVQVQSRIKMLEKMEKIEGPSAEQQSLHIQLRASSQSFKDVLSLNDVSFKYDKDWILKNINLSLFRGEKTALVGDNGAGKTTMTRLIVGQLQPQAGELHLGERVSVGYYAQHQVDALDFNNNVYEEVEKTVAASQIPNVRNILGLFGFHGDDVFKPISVLSGGEKARVSLTKILLSPVNFLIMDEPTNHLDIRSKLALEHALVNYDGTLILISHDRYFLDRIVSRVVEVKNKNLSQYQGNYSDYLYRKQKDIDTERENASQVETNSPKNKKREQAEARQAVSKIRNDLTSKIQDSEEKIEALESQKKELENYFSDPESFKNGDDAGSRMKEYQQIKNDLENIYEFWEQTQLDLELLLESIQK
jgi:ATP-binding cassette, subfamily F, member 3